MRYGSVIVCRGRCVGPRTASRHISENGVIEIIGNDKRTDPPSLRILFSFDNVGEATINPFTDMLFESVRTDSSVPLAFSWRAALSGGYDVLHLHWPEMHLRDRVFVRRMAQYLAWTGVLGRAWISRKLIAQTQHNARPHESGRPGERFLLWVTNRRTRLWIRLVDDMEIPASVPAGAERVTIPHGTYLDRYRSMDVPDSEPGLLLFFGLIRRYKGIDALITAFATLGDPDLRLRIVGEPQDTELAEQVRRAASDDPRVSVRLEFLPEADLVREIGRAEVVVLPYDEMNNSGAALLALSLERPIVVPDGAVTRELRSEVGGAWVAVYDRPFGESALRGALAEVRAAAERRGDSGLERIGWPEIGARHLEAYRRVLGR